MPISTKTLAAAGAAAVLLAGTAAAAQDTLTENEVRDFLQATGQQAEQAVAAGNWGGIRDWIGHHLSEDARLAIEGSVVSGKGPLLTYGVTMDRTDLERLALAMPADPTRLPGGTISDYAISTSVGDVSLLPDGTAVANVVFSEQGTIGGGKTASEQTLAFQSRSECRLRLNEAGGTMQIEMAACRNQTLI